MTSQNFNSFSYIKSLSVAGLATQVATGAATLERIVVNVSTVVVIAIIDGTSGSTANIAKIYKNPTTGDYSYNLRCSNGIRIITTGATNITPDITVIWRQ